MGHMLDHVLDYIIIGFVTMMLHLYTLGLFFIFITVLFVAIFLGF